MTPASQPTSFRYIKTTQILRAKATIPLPMNGCLRFISQREASGIAQDVGMRHVYGRHSWENDFYYRRALQLADSSVIEFDGAPDLLKGGWGPEGTADKLEKLIVVSSALAIPRKSLHRQLGVGSRNPTSIDVLIIGDYRHLSSTKLRPGAGRGLLVDDPFRRRYARCGFPALAEVLLSSDDIAVRIAPCLDWLWQSRTDPGLHAAIAKTATSFETLLIVSSTEPLAHTLSERASLMLSQEPAMRSRISRVVKQFYEARSYIVHGNGKKARHIKPELLEAVDRLVLLLCLQWAANPVPWASIDTVRTWCEEERWGAPSRDIHSPFPGRYVADAVAMAEAIRVA